ncbi:hypothetical protein HY750_03765 [Candidatus Kuenenbacteria bacterium]|nr:hypothetical protein [Candidatus Kuenenbacteria bacterium]
MKTKKQKNTKINFKFLFIWLAFPRFNLSYFIPTGMSERLNLQTLISFFNLKSSDDMMSESRSRRFSRLSNKSSGPERRNKI